MRRGLYVVIATVLVVLAGCGAPPGGAPDGVAGDWNGSIRVPGQALTFAAHLGTDGTGTVDIPAQGAKGLAVTDLTVDGTAVAFMLPAVPGGGAFTGTLSADGATITGDFTQGSAKVPFTMTRGALAPPVRPQEPQPPYPYRSADVTFPSGPITVAGTLTEPQGPGPFPAVVLVTGSGAQDRDETIADHKPFLLLADRFTRAGFAVLRTDDRGVGGTGGALDTSTYDDLSGDTLAGVAFLRGRTEIDTSRIGLLGHSEGGYLAPLAAQRSSGQVAFVVMMAGPAVTGADDLIEQNKLIFAQQGSPQAAIDAQVAFLQQLTALLRDGKTAEATTLATQQITQQAAALPPDQQPGADAVVRQAEAITSPVFAAFVNYDPAPALSALSVPVLAFYGDKDLQVPSAQNAPAAQMLFAGKRDASVHTFGGVNHLMQPTQTGAVSEYGSIETTIDPPVLDYVTQWLTQRFAR